MYIQAIIVSTASFLWTMVLSVLIVASLTYIQYIMWDFLLRDDDSNERYRRRRNAQLKPEAAVY
jgi:hypothetical protein